MAALKEIKLALAALAPGEIPEELYVIINDLYAHVHDLEKQVNDAIPVMQSPNGNYWTGAISNAGVVTWTNVGTVRP